MTTLLIVLAVQAALLAGVRFAPKPLRYGFARWLRRYANYTSPDNF